MCQYEPRTAKSEQRHYFEGTKVQNILQKTSFLIKKDNIRLIKCENFSKNNDSCGIIDGILE